MAAVLKYLYVFLLVSCLGLASLAQQNAVYLEIAGQSGFYSINYERQFGDIFTRIGLGYVPALTFSGPHSEAILGLPLELGFVRRMSNHGFEFSTSLLYLINGNSNLNPTAFREIWILFARVGYRFQYQDFLFRVGFTPQLCRLNLDGDYGDFFFKPYVGLCLGYSF